MPKGQPSFVLENNLQAELFLATFIQSGGGTVVYKRGNSPGGGNPGGGGNPTPVIVSNLNFSAPELTEYSKRFMQEKPTGQNYYAAGEGGTNFPGDGLKLRQQTDAFIADNNYDATNSYLTKYFWTGPTRISSTGHVMNGNEVPEPKATTIKDNEPQYSQSGNTVNSDGSGITLYKASVRLLIDKDFTQGQKDTLALKIIKQIIAYSNASYLDYRNATLFPANKYNDINPIFFIEGLMTRLKRTWENVKAWATTAEKIKVDTWFFWFYRYMQDYNNETYPNSLFESSTGVRGWNGRVQCDAEELYNMVNPSSMDQVRNTYTHRGGYNLTTLVMFASNRRTTNIMGVGIAACFFKKDHYIDYTTCYRYNSSAPGTPISGTSITSLSGVNAKIQQMYESAFMYFKEAIRFGFYPDGTCGELYRASATDTEQGMNYFAVALGSMIMYCDTMARMGDRRPYEFSTSYGRGLTLGGPKSIWTIAKNFADHYSHAILRYAQGTSGTDTNLLQDGIQRSPLTPKHYAFDNILAPLVMYGRLIGKDATLLNYLDNVMKRKKSVISTLSDYDSNIQKIGDFDGHEGSFCNMPGGAQARYYDMHQAISNVYDVYPLLAA